MLTNNVIIATIQETWLSPNVDMTFCDYNIVRKDRFRGRPHSGLAILIHKSIKFSNMPLNIPGGVEVVVIKLTEFNVAIISADSTDRALDQASLDALTSLRLPFVIGADLNAKHTNWNNSCCNSNGKTLDAYLKRGTYSIYILSGHTFALRSIQNNIHYRLFPLKLHYQR
ncbi:hypothetical protein WH47_02918 [Habropoda laboriosa]|uniref:Endonuclease/exonuclease/phosphatase domain-containing protein n=1 Tax=Habropoda laboriosa TaxID=597456 RepID=A0A0L7RHS0_9HYME|nr:hypothetical protein WH47_02918 [Habropoda laboriosa]